ncbi:MAG: thiamine diphosphokinase [Clostridiales bacterium]|nr:thiamine diphosphokinase [Clostridiales bacterium]
MNTCYIIGAGDCGKISIKKDSSDFVIAADGGLKYCLESGISPDMIVGDFDSLGYVPKGKTVIVLPVEKDDTDMYFAVNRGLEKSFKKFIIFGGTGGDRPEHTYANIALLAYISQKGGRGFLISDSYSVTAITNSSIEFDKNYRGNISVFSFTDKSRGVCETGLKYTLNDKTLTSSVVLGISNSFMGCESCVSVKEGTLIIYYDRAPL